MVSTPFVAETSLGPPSGRMHPPSLWWLREFSTPIYEIIDYAVTAFFGPGLHVLLGDPELVSQGHPGRGRFVELPGLDHAFTYHASLEASWEDFPRGVVIDAVLSVFVDWMEEVMGGS